MLEYIPSKLMLQELHAIMSYRRIAQCTDITETILVQRNWRNSELSVQDYIKLRNFYDAFKTGMTGSMIEVMNRRTRETAEEKTEEKTDEKTEEQEQVRA
jgi:hypothetical protein